MLTADVVIVGGGIMGTAVAHALAVAGFDGSVVIVERDPSYREASTGRSAGGVRLQFSTPENIRMSAVTVDLLENLKSVFGADADVAFRGHGYLILASAEGHPVLLENAAIQRADGAATQILGPSELARRFPWLATDGIAAGAFGGPAEGWLDPASLHGLFRQSALASGCRQINGTVQAIGLFGPDEAAVELREGIRIDCSKVVNAAGAWAGRVAAAAELELPVEPRKRFVFVLECRDAPESLRRAPLTVDPSGVYFRPEGRYFICGLSPGENEEPIDLDLDAIDHSWFEDRIWPVLAARVPAFEAVKVASAWAGYYDVNTLDHNAIIGPHPDHSNMLFINGFSGHGIQQAAAAGRAIAEHIMHGRTVSLDLTRFGYDRIRDGRPVRERNVI
ncbi:MAG: FAD-binding oxidoreductase [Hyphomicrobiaceae bacterium]|nr:FAD-binding oxidoreductase [Hyphomicrobiaceae bacterium]